MGDFVKMPERDTEEEIIYILSLKALNSKYWIFQAHLEEQTNPRALRKNSGNKMVGTGLDNIKRN